MKPRILCHIRDCVRPASTACQSCDKRLCNECYGAGTPARCARCYDKLRRKRAAVEEARREAASQAAAL